MKVKACIVNERGECAKVNDIVKVLFKISILEPRVGKITGFTDEFLIVNGYTKLYLSNIEDFEIVKQFEEPII